MNRSDYLEMIRSIYIIILLLTMYFVSHVFPQIIIAEATRVLPRLRNTTASPAARFTELGVP